jgi:DNA polymerase-4
MLLHHALDTPHNARVLYVDMNGFFASIEQQDHPALQGKPVAVVSHQHPRATVLASSYEAKALGITTGTRMMEAREKCPGITCLDPRPHRYKEVHRQIMEILENICGPEVQPRSIDEAAVFLSPNWQSSEVALEVAQKIKTAFKATLGPMIRGSIGIAPNSLLAKLATDLQKPDGLVEITLENTWKILEPLPLTALPGIAEKMARRLEKRKIFTPQDLYATPASQLKSWFGIWGQYWWWRLHGYECDDDSRNGLKSMSHEHVLSQWLHTRAELEAVVMKMSDRLLYRLHRNHYQCRSAFLIVKLAGAPSFLTDRSFDAPLNSYPVLLETFRNMLESVPAVLPYPVRKVCIGFHGLTSEEQGLQLELYENETSPKNIAPMLLAIRSQFGYEAIQPASALSLKRDVAKEQLGFGRIRDT